MIDQDAYIYAFVQLLNAAHNNGLEWYFDTPAPVSYLFADYYRRTER